jgi:uncharacterized protein YaiE (UPF0345 family)
MTKQLKFTSLLLLVTSMTFAQKGGGSTQSAIIKSKSNISNNRSVVPINGHRIEFRNNQGGGAPSVVTTNVNGEAQFTISAAGDYTVTVKTSASVPVEGAIVWYGENPGDAYKFAGRSNSNGILVLKNIAGGSYTMIVQKDNARIKN